MRTLPFNYPPDGIPRPRPAISLLENDLLEYIVCQDSLPPEVLQSCPYFLPEHPMSYDASLLGLNKVLAGIFDDERDILISDMCNEDDGHALWDDLIRRPLSFLSARTRYLDLQFARNSTDVFKSGTVKKSSRPDFLCYMQKSLVLRGEEKRSTEDLEVAHVELITKLDEWSPMFYGNLPFVFGYATGGLRIQYVLSFSFIIYSLNLGLEICWFTR